MPRKKRKYEETITLGYTNEGRRIRKYIGADSKSEFERLKREAIIEAEKVKRPSSVTFGIYAKKWFKVYKNDKAEKTKEMYQTTLNKFQRIDPIPIRDVTQTDLQLIINENKEHPKTCSNIALTLKQIFKAAIRDGIIPAYNPAEDLELPKYVPQEMRFITDKEMKKILKCKFEPQDKLYIEVLRKTGMRPAEALALQWGDLDKDVIHVNRSFEWDGNNPKIKLPKTNRKRVVPVPKSFIKTLRDAQNQSLFVFSRADGSPLTLSAYKEMYKRIFTLINAALGGTENIDALGGMNFYSFRHTYATQILYYKGVKTGLITAKQAAKIMGHSEQIFISRYTHIDESKEALNAIRKLVI